MKIYVNHMKYSSPVYYTIYLSCLTSFNILGNHKMEVEEGGRTYYSNPYSIPKS